MPAAPAARMGDVEARATPYGVVLLVHARGTVRPRVVLSLSRSSAVDVRDALDTLLHVLDALAPLP